MKVHNNLKELLAELVNVCESKSNNALYHMTHYEIVDDFLKANSLALGKPEPLAKNKQTQEFKCNYCKDHGFILMVPLHGDYMTTKADCPYCTKRADATSR